MTPDHPLSDAPLDHPPESLEQQVSTLRNQVGEILGIAEAAKRRAKYALFGAVVIVFIGFAIGVGSLITNVAIGRLKDLETRDRSNNIAAICRSNINGAYTSIARDRDNAAWLALLAQSDGDTATYEAQRDVVRGLATTIQGLPPSQQAFADGVTVQGVKYPACEGSKFPPPPST